jgi:endonuclease/exonuclease/phosphatase family metal-dependent hydrolase
MILTHGLRPHSIAVVVLFVGLAIHVRAQGYGTDTFPSQAIPTSQLSFHATATDRIEDHSAEERDPEFHVLTYNTQFRDTAADLFAPGWPNTRRRARTIGQAIACYDLIALQEEFRDDRRAEVVQAAQTAGAHCGKPSQFASGLPFTLVTGPAAYPITSSPLITTIEWTVRGLYDTVVTAFGESAHAVSVTNSGLLLLSRYPVRHVDLYTFQHKAGFDAWARKGVIHAVICREAAGDTHDCLDVFVTHLQARPREQAQRLGQVQELAHFIHAIRTASPDRPALIMGDFNINSASDKSDPSASQYAVLRDALSAADPGVVDLWASQQTTVPGCTNRRRRKRIDYIFVTPHETFQSRAVNVNEFPVPTLTAIPGEPGDRAVQSQTPHSSRTFRFLSDHAGVEAHFVWAHPSTR